MKQSFSFTSHNKKTPIHVVIWKPNKPAHGILQIVHGMAEYIERYETLANYLTQQGWVVVGHDHLGHGESVDTYLPHGFFDKKKGPEILIDDTLQVTKNIKKEYPTLPLFILGHSMGSFVVRNYLKDNSELVNGAILMGTGSEKKELSYVLPILRQLNYFQPTKINETIDRLAFGNFRKKFPEKGSSFNWLSKNQENVRRYDLDPNTGFIFSNNAFYTLFQLMHTATKKDWPKGISTKLPVLVISGENDPVGDFGKGPRKTASELKEHGLAHLTLHLYHNLRHELLNEEDSDLIMSDITEWMEMCIEKNWR